MFKEHQGNEDVISNLQKDKERLELQIQDMTSQQQQQQQDQQQQQQQQQQLHQHQQSSSSQVFPVVQQPEGPTGNNRLSTPSVKKESQGPQVT